jgi:hypothetical protein
MATFINFTYQIFVHQFFKNSQYTANGERWLFFRVFMWAFPVKEILHGRARLGTLGQATAGI